jgi:hypothetical protein
MEKNNITLQPKPSKKTHRIKEHLSQLASGIKVRMDENQILMDTINTVCINIKKSRQQLKKFISNQTKDAIKLEMNKNNTHIKSSNKNLITQKKMLFHKYIKLKNKFFTELEPINTELKLLSDRKFIMENIMIKRDFEIEKLELESDNIFDPLTREDQRDIFTNNIDIDEDNFIFMLEKNQSTLLNKLKEFNKYNIKVNELIKEKKMLQNIIKKLKDNKKLKDFSLDEQNILLKKINPKKNIINIENEQNIDNSGIKTLEKGNISILSDIMNDTINSEYEEEDNIEFITEQKNYKPIVLTTNLRSKIPTINLQQIEYNKMKFKQEYHEKSLSREIKNMDEFDIKKEMLKSLIKKEKFKNKKLSNKCNNLVQKINMMKKIIKNMINYNYQLCQSSFRDKKLGNNVQKQFNALSGRNLELINFKLNYEDNLDINKVKNQKDKNEIIINDISDNNKKIVG